MRGGKREGAGRKPGSVAKKKRKTSTITIWPEYWDVLDKIGPSRGKAVEKMVSEYLERGRKAACLD